MKMRKGSLRLPVICAAALAALQLVFLAGCGSRSMDGGRTMTTAPTSGVSDSRSVIRRSVDLTVWGSEEDQPMLRRQCDAFCAGYTDADVNVTLRTMSADDAADAVTRDPGGAADVFAVKGSSLGALARAGALGENTMTKSDVSSRFTSDDMASAIVDGRLYGYPCYKDACILYYDKSKLSEKDVSSLEGIAEKIRSLNNDSAKTDKNVCPFAADMSETDFASSVFVTASMGGSDTLPDSADGIDLASDESLEAARYIASLGKLGAEDMDVQRAAERFRAGTLASYAAGTECESTMKRALGDNYGAAELPSIRLGNNDVHLTGFSDSVLYAVKSTTSHPKEAAALADYLTGDQCMLDRLGKRGLLPAGSRLANHPSVKAGSAAAALRSQLDHSIVSPAADALEDMWQPVAQLGRELFGGKISDNDIKGRLGRLPRSSAA